MRAANESRGTESSCPSTSTDSNRSAPVVSWRLGYWQGDWQRQRQVAVAGNQVSARLVPGSDVKTELVTLSTTHGPRPTALAGEADAKVVPTVVAEWLEEAFRGH